MPQTSDKPIVLPDVLAQAESADGVILTIRIPETLAYFDGHFEQIPIVPGVVQIQWAVHFARHCLGLGGGFSHMEAVKFKELLLAGQPVALHLCYQEPAHKLEFCYRSEDAEYSSGRVYFHEPLV